MPEIRLGGLHIQFGNEASNKEKIKSSKLTYAQIEWQNNKAGLLAEALRAPELHVASEGCPFDCGWWTMAISHKTAPDIARAAVFDDIWRHIFRCPNAPPEARAKSSGLRPSH